MTLQTLFAITPAERARLAAAFRLDERAWLTFAIQVCDQVLKAYADGEIPLERAIESILSGSIGCRPGTRAMLTAVTAKRAVAHRPKKRRGKRPQPPTWVRASAFSLLQMLREDRPNEPFIPNDNNDWNTPIFRDAIAMLVTVGFCKPMSQRTLYQWYLAEKRAIQSK